jgi:hypothetical protein
MLAMVEQVVAGARMREDRQAVAVERDPLSEVAELLGPDRELAASAWMRADRSGMEVPHRHSEARTRRLGDTLRAFKLVGIEIDVCVEIPDVVLGHDHRLAERRGEREVGVSLARAGAISAPSPHRRAACWGVAKW